jgi:Uma2 family endonuclease
MTYKEFAELPDDGKRYELIEGELILNASPVTRHQQIVRRILASLDRYFMDHGGGEVFVSPLDVVLADDVVLEPDLMVIRSERMSIVAKKNIQGAPNIVIEVLSESTRRKDQIIKRKLYERFGIDEYWLVDPDHDNFTIYRRSGTAFARVEAAGTITSPLLPGFTLDVNNLFDF